MSTRAVLFALEILLLSPMTLGQWKPAGGIPGGNVSATLLVGDTIYAGLGGDGTESGEETGVFRSTDFGATWERSGVDAPITALAACGSAVLAGTWSSGIWRSTDGGGKWQHVWGATGSGIAGPFCVVDSIVYCGSNGSGVVFSGDHGATWNSAGHTWVREVAAAGPLIFTVLDEGISLGGPLRSSTDLLNWTYVPSPADYQGANPELAVSGSTLFLSTEHGMFTSSDFGASWTGSNKGVPDDQHARILSVAGVYVIIHTGEGLYRSSDLGASWDLLAKTPRYVGITSFSVKESLLVLGTNGAGVYVSRNGGQTWSEPTDGLSGKAQSLLSIDKKLLAGTKTGGVFLSTDSGRRWQPKRTGMGNKGVHSLCRTATRIFATQNWVPNVVYSCHPSLTGQSWGGGSVSVSTDQGASWSMVDSLRGFESIRGVYGVNGWVFASVQLGGGEWGPLYGAYVSTDEGTNWTKVDTLAALHTFAYTDSLLYGGNGSVYLSRDGGSNWQKTAYPQRPAYADVRALAANRRLAAAASVWQDSASLVRKRAIHLSTNGGDTWRTIDTGALGEGRTLIFLGDVLVAGTTTGIYRLSPDGRSWSQLSDGLTESPGGPLTIHGNELFLIGSSGTVWHRPISEITGLTGEDRTPLPSRFSLAQNYPNPFNPSTTIRYGLPNASHVVLTVYNTLGQQIVELVNGDIDAGFHEVQFNAGNGASGVYFYRLQAGSYVDVKKLALLR